MVIEYEKTVRHQKDVCGVIENGVHTSFPEIMNPVSLVTASLVSDIFLHFSYNWLSLGINFQAQGFSPLCRCQE